VGGSRAAEETSARHRQLREGQAVIHRGAGSLAFVTQGEERTRWTIHSDRVVDENPHIRLSNTRGTITTG
jgi:hypothetical protein